MQTKISRQRVWQLKNKSKGLCRTCSKKAVNATYCEEHRVKSLKIKRNRYKELKEEKSKR